MRVVIMNQYCMYLRKSRKDIEAELSGEGETLARHERRLTELASRMNLKIKCIYKEIISGENISSRPVMQRLLSEVENDVWNGVFVMEVERLARGNTIDQGIVAQAFKLSNTKIITPLKVFDPSNEFDEEYFEFGLFMSRREYKTITRRLQRGRISSVQEGKYVANTPPYGYVRKKLESEKGYTLEPNQEEASVIRMIFDLYTLGEIQSNGTFRPLGTEHIANKLNTMEIAPRRSDHWSASTIRDILINPVYIGKIRWNWRPINKKIIDGVVTTQRSRSDPKNVIVVNGLHKPIVTEETFYMASKVMEQRSSNRTGKENMIKNPLAGIVFCAKCGNKMTRKANKLNGSKKDILLCSNNRCDNVSCALHYVEHAVEEWLKDWMDNYYLELFNPNLIDYDKHIEIKKRSIKAMEKKIKNIENQINNMYTLLETDVYSSDVFLERLNANCKELNRVKDDKAKIENELNFKNNKTLNDGSVKLKTLKVYDVYKSLESPKEKNKFLKELIEKIVYLKTSGGRWSNTQDNLEISIYPKLPKMF